MSFAERNPVRLGVIGTVVLVVLTLLAVNVGNLPLISGGREYTARFTDASGLAVGDDVQVGGFTVGKVLRLTLDRGQVAVRFLIDDSGVTLADRTTAAIRTATVLGTRNLQVTSRGSGTLPADGTIPVERTRPAYQLTDDLATLTNKVGAIDTGRLATLFDTLARTLHDATPDVPAALDGVTRLSTTIASRDQALRELLGHADGVTDVLARRTGQITTMLGAGAQLFAEVQRRRTDVDQIGLNVATVARELRGLVRDNRAQLPGTLEHLDHVLELLRHNQGNLAAALRGLGPFARALGESVASGPWFDAYIPNIVVAGNLSPFPGMLPAGGPKPAPHPALPGLPPATAPTLPIPGAHGRRRPSGPPGDPRRPEPENRRRPGATALGIGLVVAFAVLVGSWIALSGTGTSATVHFPSALGLYPGDDVRVLGVRVGKVDGVSSGASDAVVRIHYDSDVAVPADARAMLVAQSLVTSRFVQLTPVYTGGPVLADGAVIPRSRTAVPVEWDQIKDQLSRLATALGPQGADRHGSLSNLVSAGAEVGRGQGTKFRQTLASLSDAVDTLSESRGDLFGTVRNLQTLITALRASNDLVVDFTNRLADVSDILDRNRTELADALHELDDAAGQVTTFVRDNRDRLDDTVDDLGQVTSVLVRQRTDLENILHVAPTALSNFYNIYDPASGSLTGALAASNVQDPAEMVCSGFAAAASSDPRAGNALCKRWLDPLLRTLATNYPPVGVNAYQRPGGVPPPRGFGQPPGGTRSPVLPAPGLSGLVGGAK